MCKGAICTNGPRTVYIWQVAAEREEKPIFLAGEPRHSCFALETRAQPLSKWRRARAVWWMRYRVFYICYMWMRAPNSTLRGQPILGEEINRYHRAHPAKVCWCHVCGFFVLCIWWQENAIRTNDDNKNSRVECSVISLCAPPALRTFPHLGWKGGAFFILGQAGWRDIFH